MTTNRAVSIPSGDVRLPGTLTLPRAAHEQPPCGVVLFAHGSGSSRLSPRNVFVAERLNAAGVGTLLMDLLTPEEDRDEAARFDIALLTARLADAVRFTTEEAATARLPIGLFGASTGAAAALRVAATMPDDIQAVVSRGGRPDLAGQRAMASVRAATLFIVGGHDHGVIELNEAAYAQLACKKKLAIVPRATHLFPEPGALEEVARLAAEWFRGHLRAAVAGAGEAPPV